MKSKCHWSCKDPYTADTGGCFHGTHWAMSHYSHHNYTLQTVCMLDSCRLFRRSASPSCKSSNGQHALYIHTSTSYLQSRARCLVRYQPMLGYRLVNTRVRNNRLELLLLVAHVQYHHQCHHHVLTTVVRITAISHQLLLTCRQRRKTLFDGR